MSNSKSMIQSDMRSIKGQQRANPVDVPQRIFDLARRLDREEILEPPFQRDYVWKPDQARSFVETIMRRQAIGVIVTYQLLDEMDNGNFATWLADGVQRLTTTLRYMQNPGAYGFDYGPNEAEGYCQAFSMPVQHRHYKDHSEAMDAFQIINQGTQVTLAEFYKGILTLGGRQSQWVESEIPAIVETVESPFYSKSTPKRSQVSTRRRDCFGLFLQYISEDTRKTFWNVSGKKGKPVEECLLDELKKQRWSQEQLQKRAEQFKTCLSEQAALIRDAIREVGQPDGKPFLPACFRWWLHLGIYRKNKSIPIATHRALLLKFLDHAKSYNKFSSMLDFQDGEKNVRIILKTDSLTDLPRIATYLNVQYAKPSRQTSSVKRGHQRSHVHPVSQYGEGQTVIEPSLLNRARGNAPMTEQELQYRLSLDKGNHHGEEED